MSALNLTEISMQGWCTCLYRVLAYEDKMNHPVRGDEEPCDRDKHPCAFATLHDSVSNQTSKKDLLSYVELRLAYTIITKIKALDNPALEY